MASILIVKKQTTPGKKNLPIRTRYHVRWERGRGRPVVHLGVFDTETRAKKKRQSALDQLARGEVPSADPLDTGKPANAPTMRDVAPRWLERRLKIAESTRASYQNVITNHLNPKWGDDDPHTISVEDVQDWIAAQNTAGVGAATIKLRLSVLKMVLRHAKVKPNPASDDEIELPRIKPSKNRMPSRGSLASFYAELDKIADGKYSGVVRLMEQTGLRVHEAVAVRHEHWDRPRKSLLIPDSKTVAGERWIDQVDGLPVMPERGVGRVWPNITISGTKGAIRMATTRSGVKLFSSHDLRKLNISKSLRGGTDPILVSVRAGHSSPQITLSKYAKLVPPD